jgi:hypothetical protein
MAIYHLSVKLITRGAGRSSTAASAYRAADRIVDERTGLVFDYTRKRGVEHTEPLGRSIVSGCGMRRSRPKSARIRVSHESTRWHFRTS